MRNPHILNWGGGDHYPLISYGLFPSSLSQTRFTQFAFGRRCAAQRTPISEHGLLNTRALGGSAIKQHYVLLLAGRHLSPPLFSRLCLGIEQVMCVWLFAGVPAKDYERAITAAARALRGVRSEADFQTFELDFIIVEKRTHARLLCR